MEYFARCSLNQWYRQSFLFENWILKSILNLTADYSSNFNGRFTLASRNSLAFMSDCCDKLSPFQKKIWFMCNVVRAKQQDWTTTSLIIESVNKALWMNGLSSTALIGWLRGVKPRLNVFAVYTNMKLGIWSILKVRIGLWIREFKMTLYLLFYSWHCCFCYYVENRFSYRPIYIYSKLAFCVVYILFCF